MTFKVLPPTAAYPGGIATPAWTVATTVAGAVYTSGVLSTSPRNWTVGVAAVEVLEGARVVGTVSVTVTKP